MADTNTGPRNRRERRAAAREAGNHPSTASASGSANTNTSALTRQRTTSDIPLAQPDRSGPKGKTLYDLAEERMAELQKQGQPFAKASSSSSSAADDDDFGPAAEALLWAFSLTMVHLTLDVLVHNQYREEIAWDEVWKRTVVVLPSMWLIIYLFHTKTALKFKMFRQLVYLGIACAGGCYCVYVGNTFGYFAVMKQTPPVGTLWIWSVVEMQKWYALASIIVVGLYTLWNGYGLF